MFQDCFKTFQDWREYTELPPLETPEYDQAKTLPHDFQIPTWLHGTWPNCFLEQSRLSPIHWEPLRLQDIYRCPKALLECEEKHLHYQNKRYDVFKICQQQEESGHAVNWDTYKTIYHICFMWFWRKKILTCRLQAAIEKFPDYIRLEYHIQEYKLTLARALHRRVKALGTCKLRLLNSDLLQHIFALSVDA